MMHQSRRLSPWGIIFFLLLLAACVPAVVPEPEAAAYPAGDMPTATPLPYPWPTRPPSPTEEPTVTDEPPPTETSMSTPTSTPVVTPIPTAAPPIIALPEGATAEPFSLYWRDGDVILTLRSEGQAEPEVFLDPVKEFGLYPVAREVDIQFRSWGTISPDGRTFALLLTDVPNHPLTDWPYPAHIYLLDRESRELRQVARYAANPVWSPDGRWLAYRSLETEGLWVADLLSGKAHEVYAVDRDKERLLGAMTWSHDSRHLALIDQVIAQSTALVIVNVQQSEPPRVLIEDSLYLMGRPQWSPVSDLIAFPWLAGEGGKGPHMWVINSDGSERKQLTNSVEVIGELSLWSVDSEWIALGGVAQHERGAPNLDLWLVDTEGTEIKRITYSQIDTATQFGVNALMPLWTPDGTQLVFIRVPPQNELAEIWAMSLADGREWKLVEIMNVFDDGLIVGP